MKKVSIDLTLKMPWWAMAYIRLRFGAAFLLGVEYPAEAVAAHIVKHAKVEVQK